MSNNLEAIPTLGKERFIRLEEVKNRTGLSRSSIYAFIKAGTFPAPASLGARSVGWLESQIDAWIAARISKKQAAAG